ncbi:TadE/TadG family type IV pilus assembly protein [Corallococcus sp. EGB]|uniref:TadE/TadG family type IV pilus assembly protein n=1 Tax=Corallococcus sp. EGB TaxID=1521117 RepID=UPI001CBD3000|nr:TadE/TadG family type IV pilus assembly protein [Corallococcus sp. EGB]
MRSRYESGQVAVETAIVLPLFIFLLLGILQLGLMHQARLLTKYAAYKAVRAGSLHNGNVEMMERAALAVLLPMISQAGSGGAEKITPVNGASEFNQKWNAVSKNKMPEVNLKYAEVQICGPSKNLITSDTHDNREADFDDARIASGNGSGGGQGDWGKSLRTKLSIQVTFNYRLPIPFADVVIYNIARGQRTLPWVLRLGKEEDQTKLSYVKYKIDQNDAAAAQKIYILPIRATYIMRMQSNLYLSNSNLPDSYLTNKCTFTFDSLG